jgi:hypothetical protein
MDYRGSFSLIKDASSGADPAFKGHHGNGRSRSRNRALPKQLQKPQSLLYEGKHSSSDRLAGSRRHSRTAVTTSLLATKVTGFKADSGGLAHDFLWRGSCRAKGEWIFNRSITKTFLSPACTS